MKSPLLLYLAHARDPHRCAVGPALAAAAERAGWVFDVYYDQPRSGRHFGGGDPDPDSHSVASGSLVAGGRHLDHALWLTTAYHVAAVGDSGSPIWPVIEAAGEVIERTADPAGIFAAAFARLRTPLPTEVMVLDAAPQTKLKLVTAPFLYPRLLMANCLGVDAICDANLRRQLESLGAHRFIGLFVDPDRASEFPGHLDAVEGEVRGETYATLTSSLARKHALWGRGTLLGDPDLVTAQLPLAVRRRLIPLYGRPQTDVIERAVETIRGGEDPVYGRQFDDHDFFALGRLGRGLQIFDPDPPFASAASVSKSLSRGPTTPRDLEPDDEALREWAEAGWVLTTLVLWAGMIRELHCIPRIIDLVAATGLRCGLVVTTDTLAHATPSDLSLLAVPPERGGVLGQIELLLGSTGRGVCAEAYMPDGELARLLGSAKGELANRLSEDLMPRGWWPLLDSKLVASATPRVSWEGWRPILRVPARPQPDDRSSAHEPPRHGYDARRVIKNTLRRYHLDQFFDTLRPYDHARPGPFEPAVADAARSAGFEYMWTKAGFGRSNPRHVIDDFVALPFTAGDWDGWSPFYTVHSTAQVTAAERSLLRGRRPAWLASNVDSILWTLPGEVLEKGHVLFEIAQLIAKGGRSGRLVNVTPNVIARYARILSRESASKAGSR